MGSFGYGSRYHYEAKCQGASFNAGGSVVVVVVVGLLGGAIAMQLTINSNFNGWSLVP